MIRSNKGGAFVTSLLTSLIVSLAVCVAFNYFGADILEKIFSQTAEVPNLSGMTFEQATASLTEKKLLVSVEKEMNNPIASKGVILSQNPSPGLKVKKASTIVVVTSSGKTIVPKLAGLAADDAKTKIAEAGLAAGAELEEESDKVPAGSVVATDPEEGAEVLQATPVTLVVSKGVGAVRVPKVTGKSLVAAKRALAAAGFTLGAIKEETSEYYQFNIVIAQSPKAGAKAAKGSAVRVTINVEAEEEQ